MGGEIILLNCCKWLQINSTFFTVRSLWFSLDAAVEQRRREDAKPENQAMLAISPKAETFIWQVNPNHPQNCLFPALSSRLRAFVVHSQLRSLWFGGFEQLSRPPVLPHSKLKALIESETAEEEALAKLTRRGTCCHVGNGMSVTIQLDLPEALVKEAQPNGLLESRRLGEMLNEELVRERARKDLGRILKDLHSLPGEPMSPEEIQAEIDAVRAQRHRRESGH